MPEPEAVALDLPASFEGTLPCADCEGIRYHLDLWPDNVFHLRREWLGVAQPRIQDDLGRWDMEPSRSVLTLFGTGEPPLKWMVIGSHSLRLLDSEGQVIVSDLPYELAGDGTLAPTSLSLQLDGEFRYMADAADFTICTTGETVPVLMEGDFVTAENAYSKTRAEPGGPVAMLVDGTLAMRTGMEGPERMSLVIDHFVSAGPSKTCAHREAEAPLVNTYWKLVRLNGAAVGVPEGGHEPHLIFQTGETPRLSATAGCNQFGGTYAVDGDTVSFGPLAGTLMACPEPLDALERDLVKVLAAPRQWQIAGQTLTLRDGDTVLAEFEAQYLP